MVTVGTAGSVEPEARMTPPWGTLVVFTEIWIAGPCGKVVGAVVGTVVSMGVVATVVTVVGTAVSFPVGGGPVVAMEVTMVVWVGAGVVSTGVTGVVTGVGVVVAGGKVTNTMVGVWGAGVLSFRR
jgi:hypothetical protein